MAVGLGGVQHTIGAAESLDQAVVLEVLVDIERVEIFRVKAGKQHVDHDGDIDLLRALAGQVGIGVLLVLDALLDVLVEIIEGADGVVGAIGGVVVGQDLFEGGFLLIRLGGVVGFFLRQVFLELADVGVAFGGR